MAQANADYPLSVTGATSGRTSDEQEWALKTTILGVKATLDQTGPVELLEVQAHIVSLLAGLTYSFHPIHLGTLRTLTAQNGHKAPTQKWLRDHGHKEVAAEIRRHGFPESIRIKAGRKAA